MKCYACDCNRDAYCKGLCKKHYTQVERHGHILNRTIFDKNEIVINRNYAEIILVNRKCTEVGRALIDLDDVERVKNFKWRLKKRWLCIKWKKRRERFNFTQINYECN